MQRKIITLTTAAAIGMAALAAATTANAGQWVYVPDGATVAPRTYYESGRRYTTEPDAYVRTPQRRVYRETVPNASQGRYVQTDTAFNDSCTYRRERNLFGGWHETRDCPD